MPTDELPDAIVAHLNAALARIEEATAAGVAYGRDPDGNEYAWALDMARAMRLRHAVLTEFLELPAGPVA